MLQNLYSLRPSAAGLAATTPMLTPLGWSSLEKLSPGDQVVDVSGTPCRVTAVEDAGTARVFDVTVADGSVVTCGAGQLWQVEVGSGAKRTAAELTTTQLADVASQHRAGAHLVRSEPVPMAGSGGPPLDPYLLGLLLSEGGLSSRTSVVLWTNEPELLRRAELALPVGTRFSDHPARQARCTGWTVIADLRRRGGNSVLNALRDLDLMGRRSYEKATPSMFLWASVEDRLALLRGLMDGDGAVSPQAAVSYSSASSQLAQDCAHLIRSLGGRCALRVRKDITFTAPTQPTPKAARDSFRVCNIELPHFNPFLLTRKAERVRQNRQSLQWSIKTVEPAGFQRLLTLGLDSQTGLALAAGFVPVSARLAAATVPALLRAA